MPYSSIAELPEHIRKLPENKQRQFLHVFNSCLAKGSDESRCFAVATSVAKKSIGDFDDGGIEADINDYILDIIDMAFPLEEVSSAPMQPVTVVLEKLRRSEMSARSFAYIDSEGGRHLPIHDAAHVRNALARFNQTHFESSDAKRKARAKILAAAKRFGVEVSKSWGDFLTDFLLPSGVAGDYDPTVHDEGGLLVVKQSDGRLRWFARYSNAWEDRDKEIVTEASHREYIDWVYANKAFPELWLWHTKGTRFGEADWLDFSSGFAHASGLVDKGKEHVAYRLAELLKAKDLGVSHGFVASQNGKYIERYRTFEITVLPIQRAAVWTTDFNLVGLLVDKENSMAFTEERRKYLVDVLGEDAVKSLEEGTDTMAKQLKELGVEYKEAAPLDTVSSSHVEALKALAGEVGDLKTAVTTIVASLKSTNDKVALLSKGDDEKMEDAFAAKVAKALQNGGVVRPTESTENTLSKKEAEKAGVPKEADFFSSMMMKQLGGVTQAAGAAGVGKISVTS